MVEKPLVSIVTPSYNQASYLEAAMLSVLEQSYPYIEYLVIDGGSTDDSVELIKQHAGKLAYWVSEPDRGQTDAINKGFARANGKYLAWLNADDLLNPTAVGEAVDFLENHPEVGMVYGDSESDRLIPASPLPWIMIFGCGWLRSANFNISRALGRNSDSMKIPRLSKMTNAPGMRCLKCIGAKVGLGSRSS